MEKESLDIEHIYEAAQKDPTLFASIDIDKLLDKIENTQNNYLENQTLETLSKTIFDVLQELDIDKESAQEYCNKLSGYRYVDRVCDLRNGIYTRWMRKTAKTPSLTNGSILVNIKMGDSIQLVARNYNGRFVSFGLDDCIIFQKLTMEEQLILMSYEYLEKHTP